MANGSLASNLSGWRPSVSLATTVKELVYTASPICKPVNQESLLQPPRLLDLFPGSSYSRHVTLPKRATEHPGRAWLTNSLGVLLSLIQIKAAVLWPSFVNSIFVLSSPGSQAVCSWTVFWKALVSCHTC